MICSVPKMPHWQNRDLRRRSETDETCQSRTGDGNGERADHLGDRCGIAFYAARSGHKYGPDDVFCYIATPWHTYDKVLANFSGRVIEVCAKQGALVDKGEPLAYIERCEEPA